MAAIRIHDSVIVLISGLSVAVANVRKPSVLKTFMVSQGQTECTDKKEDDSSCGASANNNNRILASAFSGRGRYFVVCDDRKFLHVYSTENEDWNLVNSHLLPRRATSVTFTLDESVVLVADKSGDVYSYAIAVPEARDCGEARLLLGHLSMLLDMCLADNDKYIVTCDRDEKIRISCYPNAYNIHAYCLGHKEFVSSLVCVDDFKIIVSGSGDCSLCMWDMQGKLLCKAECLPLQASNSVTRLGKSSPGCENSNGDWNAALTSDIQHRPAIQCISYCRQCQLLAVSFHGFSKLMIYHLTTENDDVAMTLIQTLELNVDPWDIKFDEQKNLWVLLPVEGSPLRVYQVDEDLTDQIQLRKCVDDISNITKLIETVNSKWDFFKDSLAVQSVVPKLWKICSQENVSEYQQRKKQRIGWQKGKNGEKEVAESQSQSAAVTGAERENSPTGKMPRLS